MRTAGCRRTPRRVQPPVVDDSLSLCMLLITLSAASLGNRKPPSQLLSQLPGCIRVSNPTAAKQGTHTGERLFWRLARSLRPRGVLSMSDTIKKQLKKRGKRKHGTFRSCRKSSYTAHTGPLSPVSAMQGLQANQWKLQTQSLQPVR